MVRTRDYDFHIAPDGIWHFSGEAEKELVKTLTQDSDRAVAIIAASIVEARLETMLLDCFVRDTKIEARLFQPSGALGSFGVKIDLIFLLGIISAPAHKDLVCLKDIRNLFAHDLSIRDFQSQKIKDRVKNLRIVDSYMAEGSLEKGEMIISMERPAPKPFLKVPSFNKNKNDPKHRYLFTAQVFANGFAGMDLHKRGGPIL